MPYEVAPQKSYRRNRFGLAGQYLLNLFFLKKLKYILQLALHCDIISSVGWLNIYIHKVLQQPVFPVEKP
jgi:hypothetical protein